PAPGDPRTMPLSPTTPTPESAPVPPSPSRRAFLGASLAGLTSGRLLAADPVPNLAADDTPFRPDTLFLTWQRDPTTPMTVQWVGPVGETADPAVYYTPVLGGFWPAGWLRQPTTPRAYPMTDFKVFRAELTGLKPGTDYLLRIGKASPTYRF